MSNQPIDNAVRVNVKRDASLAEIILAPDPRAAPVDPDICLALLTDAGVEITPEVEARVREAIANHKRGAGLRETIATSTSPVHGEDGDIVWYVGEDDDTDEPSEEIESPEPEPESPEPEAADPEDRINYYTQSTYVMVEQGQALGHVVSPTPGSDGRDVTGATLPAKPGKPPRLASDDSIILTAEGKLVAQCDGVLNRTFGKANIRALLQIPGYVDFSTGNLEFAGDIEVIRGVRDLFEITNEGNLEIRGLIEAAQIKCGGDLLARGGMAARERGSIHTGGDLHAKFLDATTFEVGGVLVVSREIINCTGVVRGSINSKRASIIGGEITVTGPAAVGTIGSGAGVLTTLILGRDPSLEKSATKLIALIERLNTQLKDKREHLENLNKYSRPSQAQTAALQGEIDAEQDRLGKAKQALDELHEKIRSLRYADLHVTARLFRGANIVVGERAYLIDEDQRGPLHIRTDRSGALEFRIGDAPYNPLSAITAPAQTRNAA